MTRRHKRIRNLAVLLAVFAVFSLFIYGQKINELKGEVEAEITKQQDEIDESNKKLDELQEEYDQMDSEQYIRQVANEKLGMVDEDTIVFRVKK